MMGICIADLIHSSGKVAQISMFWQIFYQTSTCKGAYPYLHILTNVVAKSTQIMSRRSSGFLALFIASFRAYAVIYPMSNAVNFLSEPKTGYRIVLGTMMVCGVWSSLYYFTTIIYKVTQCPIGTTPKWVMYEHDTLGSSEEMLRLTDGYLALISSFLYVLVTVAVLVALAKAKQRAKNLKSEKGTHTSMLIIIMAVLMIISEGTYGALFLTSNLIFKKHKDRGLLEEFEVLPMTLSIISSIVHCFICFFMSSQYREVVKRLLRCGKEKEVKFKGAIIESAVNPSSLQSTMSKID